MPPQCIDKRCSQETELGEMSDGRDINRMTKEHAGLLHKPSFNGRDNPSLVVKLVGVARTHKKDHCCNTYDKQPREHESHTLLMVDRRLMGGCMRCVSHVSDCSKEIYV